MKRLNKNDRKFWVDLQYSKLSLDLTCRFGAWNRDKLLDGLEKRLKKERMAR